MRISSLAVVLLVIAGNLAGWAAFNQPQDAPEFTGTIKGMSFQPMRQGNNPLVDSMPTVEQIDEDMTLLEGATDRLRTYSATGVLESVPKLARKHGFQVTLGAWIGNDLKRNEAEIRNVIKLAKANRNVDRIIIGNEALLRTEVTVDELIKYIRAVRRQVKVPVSTSEPWHIWLAHPELAKEVSYIAAHVLPYWEGTSVDAAISQTFERYDALKAAFPSKHVALTEVGWPSSGRIKRDAVPSYANQAKFVRSFLTEATERNLDYIIVEAFDQPWKQEIEGGAGAYWGLYDAQRQPKFSFTGPLVRVPNWPILAGSSALLALLPLLWFMRHQRDLSFSGRLFFGGLVQATAAAVIWTSHVYATQYVTSLSAAMLAFMTVLLALLMVVLLTEGLELTEVLWRGWRRPHKPADASMTGRTPKVSIHVPTHNEPPEMVIQTLEALARLEYPNFEVLVIDNNTMAANLWRPVEARCAELGERFRFFHVEGMKGFKAGALNFALRETAPDAEIVGVIDSDYLVDADWLCRMVPHFQDTAVGFVQAPQDYRDGNESLFKDWCYWEYAGFFQIGMVQRNERNAIIQHGTMTLVRKSALEQIDGWAEWCICEDAELGLRLFEAGYQSVYVKQSFGRGLIPDSLANYKGQRFRWAYGAVQICKRHWRDLLSVGRGTLTAGQRYHFIAGWLPWVADSLNLFLTTAILVWTVGLVADPKTFEFPMTIFVLAALTMFTFKVVKSLWLYPARVGTGLLRSVGAAVAGLAVSHTVAKAVVIGFLTSKKPFLRTPKCENQPALVRGLLMAWEETGLMALLWTGAAAVAYRYGSDEPEAMLWSAMLLVLSLPHFATLLFSMINVVPASVRNLRLLAARRAKPAASALPAPNQA
jgi:exo-beta-1,3-glucanase (GH17 family)/cellulose synthase/poly-beta-1,6-N-acetylglucosamine synthase-like glycosyltransferase